MRYTALVFAAIAMMSFGADAAAAQSMDAIFAKANEAYFAGDHEAAARGYQQLIDAGVDDANVYFNLAAAHAERGRYGAAILAFERCLRVAPGDSAALEGLAAARAALGDRRAAAEGEATVQTRPPLVEALVQPFSETTLAWLVLLLDVLVFALLWLRPRARGEARRVALAVAWPLAAVIGVLAAGALVVKSDALRDGRAAIVLIDNAKLREGPDAHARSRGTAREGEYARLLAREAGYARVELPGKRRGWLLASEVQAIAPD
jgi:tetratricopeptide (TPR) repeat protein